MGGFLSKYTGEWWGDVQHVQTDLDIQKLLPDSSPQKNRFPHVRSWIFQDVSNLFNTTKITTFEKGPLSLTTEAAKPNFPPFPFVPWHDSVSVARFLAFLIFPYFPISRSESSRDPKKNILIKKMCSYKMCTLR